MFAASIAGAAAAAKAGAGSRTHVADAAAALPVTPELRARISANIVRTMRARLPAWQPPSA